MRHANAEILHNCDAVLVCNRVFGVTRLAHIAQRNVVVAFTSREKELLCLDVFVRLLGPLKMCVDVWKLNCELHLDIL